MTLYELTGNYRLLLDSGMDKEDPQCFEDTLEAVLGEIEVKADDYAYVMAEFETRSKAIEGEISRLRDRKAVIDESIKQMKERLYTAMVALDKREITTDLHTFKIQKNGGKQAIEITGEVPDNFKRIVYENDTDRIRAALENGELLSFAVLKERGEHVRIK